MSFDFKIENGDLKVGKNGDVAIVEDSDKLVQDILKICITDVGSNKFYSWYGCPLSKSLIGKGYDTKFSEDMISEKFRYSLETLQRIQQAQVKSGQIVTPYEQIAAIQGVSVKRNPSDLRFFAINLTVVSKAFRRVDVPTLEVTL